MYINSLRLHYLFSDYVTGIMLLSLPVYLKVFLKFSTLEISIIYGVCGIIAVINSIIDGYLAQKIHKKKLVLNIGLPFLIVGVIILQIAINTKSDVLFKYVFIATIFIFLMRSIVYIIGDEIATTYVKETKATEFGKIRSFGSIGWGLNLLVNGFIFAFAPELFVPLFLVACILFWINSFLLPIANNDNFETIHLKDLTKIFQQKSYLLFLLILTMIWIVLNTKDIYITSALDDNSGSVVIYYIISFIVIPIDMFVIYISGKILKKLRAKKYMYLLLSLILIKLLLLALSLSPEMIYFVTLLDPIIFGLLIPYNSESIKKQVPNNLSTIAFVISATTALVFVSIFSFIFGIVYKYIGAKYVFVIMFIIILIAGVFANKLDYSKINNDKE